jgi:hypothetical protein
MGRGHLGRIGGRQDARAPGLVSDPKSNGKPRQEFATDVENMPPFDHQPDYRRPFRKA